MTRSIAACAAALAAAGCGGEDSKPAAGSGSTNLTVRFSHPAGPELRYRCSRCDPGKLAAIRRALRQRRPRRDVACTEIYGGPREARVSGTLEGKRVSATFNRVNGCAIAAYDALLRAFRSSSGTGGSSG